MEWNIGNRSKNKSPKSFLSNSTEVKIFNVQAMLDATRNLGQRYACSMRKSLFVDISKLF